MSLTHYFLVSCLMLCGYSQGQETGVTIGKQVWASKNLASLTFRNGEALTLCATREEWKQALKDQVAACCYPDFDPKKGEKYGLLYNVFALKDERELAPKNFRIPEKEDWLNLVEELQKESKKFDVGTRLKDPSAWEEDNNQANNLTSFNALPAGYCSLSGYFVDQGKGASFWYRGLLSQRDNYTFRLYQNYSHYQILRVSYGGGYSIRCIQEDKFKQINRTDYASISFVVSDKQDIDHLYEFMDQNLDLPYYQNGDSIPMASDWTTWRKFVDQGIGAWSYLDFDPANAHLGLLYNKFAVTDSRKLLPDPWRIPYKDEAQLIYEDLGAEASVKAQNKSYDHSQWWLYNQKKPKRTNYLLLTNNMFTEGFTTSKESGCFVRGIKVK